MPLNNTQRSINRIFTKPNCSMAFCAFLLQIEFTQMSRNRGSAGRNSFTPSSKVCLCASFHKTHACLTIFCKELLHWNVMKIWQTVYSPILGHRQSAGHVVTYTMFFALRTECLITEVATTTTVLADHHTCIYNCTFHYTVLHNTLVPIILLNYTCAGWMSCKHQLRTSCSFKRQWAWQWLLCS
jgi:hypothetical protein